MKATITIKLGDQSSDSGDRYYDNMKALVYLRGISEEMKNNMHKASNPDYNRILNEVLGAINKEIEQIKIRITKIVRDEFEHQFLH